MYKNINAIGANIISFCTFSGAPKNSPSVLIAKFNAFRFGTMHLISIYLETLVRILK